MKIRITLFISLLLSLQTTQAQDHPYEHLITDFNIAGIEAEVGISVWRDFMPRILIDTTNPEEDVMDGSGLMVAFSIIPLDESGQLPKHFTIIQAVARHVTGEWDMTTSTSKDSNHWAGSGGYSMVFRKGPRWPLYDTVDLSLVLEAGGQQYQIQSNDVRIARTD